MSKYDTEKDVYVIVHGQKHLFEPVKSKLSAFGFMNGGDKDGFMSICVKIFNF